MSAKAFIKKFIPPVLLDIKRALTNRKKVISFTGNYTNWNEASKTSKGYSDPHILEKCKKAILDVKHGRAVYERDGQLFDKIEYSWGVLAGLQKSAIENDNQLCVMDFGGSLGSSYYQNRTFLKDLKSLHWCIVEQPHFVECGKEHFEDDKLHFFLNMEECLRHHKPGVLLLSGVLQYLEEPYLWLDKFLNCGIKYIIIDRIMLVDEGNDMLSIQYISKELYEGSYPVWVFNRHKLLNNILPLYELIGEFDTIDKQSVTINSRTAKYSGMLFSKKNTLN